jgi:hypothetical protein
MLGENIDALLEFSKLASTFAVGRSRHDAGGAPVFVGGLGVRVERFELVHDVRRSTGGSAAHACLPSEIGNGCPTIATDGGSSGESVQRRSEGVLITRADRAHVALPLSGAMAVCMVSMESCSARRCSPVRTLRRRCTWARWTASSQRGRCASVMTELRHMAGWQANASGRVVSAPVARLWHSAWSGS